MKFDSLLHMLLHVTSFSPVQNMDPVMQNVSVQTLDRGVIQAAGKFCMEIISPGEFSGQGGGGISPPLRIPKLQLPNARPNMQAAVASMKQLCLLNSAALRWMLFTRGVLLHQHSQVWGLQISCAIARNGRLKDIKRRVDSALHCRNPYISPAENFAAKVSPHEIFPLTVVLQYLHANLLSHCHWSWLACLGLVWEAKQGVPGVHFVV